MRADIGAAEPGAQSPAPPIGVDAQLRLANQLARLQHVATAPGSGDRDFLRGLRGTHPLDMSDAQRAHITRLAWRYRWQLPVSLRPDVDPERGGRLS